MQLLERKLQCSYHRESYNAVIREKVTVQVLERKLQCSYWRENYNAVIRQKVKENGYCSVIREEWLQFNY